MNERIEGLWWKARIGYNNQSCDPEVLEKFAELIVQECIDIAGEEDFDVMMKEGYPCSQTAKKIKEYFGVK